MAPGALTPGSTRLPSPGGGYKRILLGLLLVSLLFVILGAAAGTVWFLARKNVALLPPAVAGVFDSADAILESARANDLEIKRQIDELPSNSISEDAIKEIAEVAGNSAKLIARAVSLNPLGEPQTLELGATDSDGKRTDPILNQPPRRFAIELWNFRSLSEPR